MRTRITRALVLALALATGAGCDSGPKQPDFPDLNPVKGVIKRGGQPVSGGSVRFNPDPDKPDFVVNSEVGTDGTYTLTTVRTTDKSGERKTGAPAGAYKVTYTPPIGDQTAGGQTGPMSPPTAVTVQAGNNDIPIDLPKK
jgi:hypothetical protein